MIMDTIANIGQYKSLGGRIARGLEALAEMDFSTMEDGKHPIDGDDVFVLLSSYTTKAAADVRPEAHKKYIDIQYLISGSEYIGCAPLDRMLEAVEEKPEKDISYYRGEVDLLPLERDIFQMFFPQDAHSPCIAKGGPMQVRKAVIKVKV